MSILNEPETALAEIDPKTSHDFEAIAIGQLSAADLDWLDRLPFGIIGIDANGKVAVYNATEAQSAGLIRHKIIGRPFFLSVAPCMNNFLVAQRFVDEPELDVIIDYVLTLRMRPTPVRLRLLNASSSQLSFILVQR